MEGYEDENMKLTIKENLINNGRIDIQPGSMLIVEGDLTNSGELGYHEINDLLVEGNIIDNGIILLTKFSKVMV